MLPRSGPPIRNVLEHPIELVGDTVDHALHGPRNGGAEPRSTRPRRAGRRPEIPPPPRLDLWGRLGLAIWMGLFGTQAQPHASWIFATPSASLRNGMMRTAQAKHVSRVRRRCLLQHVQQKFSSRRVCTSELSDPLIELTLCEGLLLRARGGRPDQRDRPAEPPTLSPRGSRAQALIPWRSLAHSQWWNWRVAAGLAHATSSRIVARIGN